MCMFKKTKVPEPPVVAKAPDAPEKPPEPVAIKKDDQAKRLRRKNPLRIEKGSDGAKPPSGVSV